LAELVKNDPGVAEAHSRFLRMLDDWWTENLPLFEDLAPKNGAKGNVYDLRSLLLASITQTFAGQGMLTEFQIRGAFARYMDDLKSDLKSIAASGWGAELIPDADILESQFPEILADMEQKRLRLAELAALFAAADEEEYEDNDDTGVLPAEEVKALKAELKEAKAQAKLAKKENREAKSYLARADEIETRLARHKALEEEAKQLKAELRVTEKKQQELVAAAREKISSEEAKVVILDRLRRLLVQTYEGYLRADQRACLAALENLHRKYAVTAREIEARRNAAAERLKGFLVELGYE
jgi:type I restriction enzyme M protein